MDDRAVFRHIFPKIPGSREILFVQPCPLLGERGEGNTIYCIGKIILKKSCPRVITREKAPKTKESRRFLAVIRSWE
jgi:hypothetical protein